MTPQFSRAAIYARISTDTSKQDTENQLIQLRQFAAIQGWTIHREYVDHASGKSDNREMFQEMLSDAARRPFDVVLVWALDRFTREGVPETFAHIQRLRSHGVEFVSFTEEHFRTTGPAGELMIAVAAWIAKQERIRLQERVRAGLERARKHGTKSGNAIGRPKRVFNRAAAIELRQAGRSWSEIAEELGVGCGTVRRACGATA
jgi:DNA invertase Pin-like site-specific DNA recombinase